MSILETIATVTLVDYSYLSCVSGGLPYMRHHPQQPPWLGAPPRHLPPGGPAPPILKTTAATPRHAQGPECPYCKPARQPHSCALAPWRRMDIPEPVETLEYMLCCPALPLA